MSSCLTNRSSGQCPQGRRQRSHQVVPSEHRGPLPVGDELRQGSLFDRQERADFVATGTDHADRGGDQEPPKVFGDGEDDPSQKHQHGTEDQHFAPSDSIRRGGNPQRDGGVAQQRQRQQQSHSLVIQANRFEVQHQHDRQEAVGEQPDAAGGKKPPTVSVQGPKCRELRYV